MKYFWTENERKERDTTCCLEFQRGEYKGSCWLDTSLCLDDDIFHDMKLYRLFKSAIRNFDHWGITEVNPEQWEKLKKLFNEKGGEYGELISELTPWAEENFKEEAVFTILGI